MRLPRPSCAVILVWLLSACVMRGQMFSETLVAPPPVRSVSGQFLVSAVAGISPLSHHPIVVGSPDFVRLEPTFLAVSAERLKESFQRALGIKPNAPWSGKIYLRLEPAQSLDADAVLVAQPFLRSWNCGVQLPDVISQTRFVRALTAALLLEFANRHIGPDGHSAEIPSWLADGLAQEILANDGRKIILSTPAEIVNDLPQARTDRRETGLDGLMAARKILQENAPLSYDELSWPTVAQLSGAGGVPYRATAQLFVHGLLGLKNGPEKMRSFLARLPQCANWQTAFYAAFAENFSSALDVEKWWALRVVNFVARDPGPGWTPANSGERLAELLAVPVEFRSVSNALPERAEVSLQTAIRSFKQSEQLAVLRIKLRDLSLAQLRMAPVFAALVEGYRRVLSDHLEQLEVRPEGPVAAGRAPARRTISVADTLKKLEALDVQRRELEMKLRNEAIQRSPNRVAP